jgi:beta-mannosidase
MARRQYAPVLVSFAPEYEYRREGVTGDTEYGPVTEFTLWVTSDVTHPLDGDVALEVTTIGGETLLEETVPADVGAGESVPLRTIARDELPDGVDPSQVLVRAEYDGAEESYPNVDFFGEFKELDLADPGLETTVDGREVTVRAAETALFVELDAGPLDGAFSDDYFHLLPGEERTVTFDPFDDETRDAVVGVRLDEHLSTRSLSDTY